MNFQTKTDFEVQLSHLLAFVIMFEKKIEVIRCKLAGNEEFHTRLAFQKMHNNNSNQIAPQDVLKLALNFNPRESLDNCARFIKKYSLNSALSYEEFLKIVTPKKNKALAQRMMVRHLANGKVFEDYLFRALCELFAELVLMTTVTNDLKVRLQQSSDLTYLETIEFFRKCITSEQQLLEFINQNSEEQYDIVVEDLGYLSMHVKSGDDFFEFTDSDFKELLVAGESYNYMRNTLNGVLSFKTINQDQDKNQGTVVNFLNKTYQKTQQPNIQKVSQVDSAIHSKVNAKASNAYRPKESSQYRELFIDNFVNGREASGREENLFLNRRSFEKFEDDLSNRSSLSRRSKESAFQQY